uniref:hypothetical protein n=1 Tax=Salmonella sp. s50237 TaxID=3159649 RepID=UPI00398166AC
NGELLTRTQLEPVGGEYEQRILIRTPKSGEFEVQETLTRQLKDRYTLNFVGIDEASGKYYVLTDLFSDRVEARMYDPVARKFDEEPLLAHPEFSISQLIFSVHPDDFGQVQGFTV